MRVSELMSRTIEWVTPGTPVREAARTLRDLHIGCVPVGERGKLLGILTDRDIVCRSVAEGLDADRVVVKDIMSPDPISCRADHSLLDAAELMRERQIRRLLVVDASGVVVGIISVDCRGSLRTDRTIFATTMKAAAHAA